MSGIYEHLGLQHTATFHQLSEINWISTPSNAYLLAMENAMGLRDTDYILLKIGSSFTADRSHLMRRDSFNKQENIINYFYSKIILNLTITRMYK